MPRSGDTSFEANQAWFDSFLRTAPVERLCDEIGEQALSIARANAPVETGAYRDDLHIEHHESRYRRTTRVVGDDEKTMLIESKTGNLARALKAAKR